MKAAILAGSAHNARELAKLTSLLNAELITNLDFHEDIEENPDLLLKVAAACLEKSKPDIIVMPEIPAISGVAPALAAMLGMSCITSVSGISGNGENARLHRAVLGGKAVMKIIPEYPVVVTVMPGFFMNISAAPETIPRMDSICHLEENCLERSSSIKTKVKILGSYESESSDTGLPITQAEVIVAAGRGIGRPENLELIGELAECFIRSAVAGSRAVIDAGLLPHGRQVGLTGKTVAPRLYIACGISGSPQHIAGMKASALVAAINKDPNAAIFSHSHYCIVEDLEKFIPVLIDELKSVHF